MNGQVDRRTILVTSLLLLSGLLLLYSASAPFSLRHFGSDTHMVLRQLVAALAGIIVLGVCTLVDYHRLARLNDAILAATVLQTGGKIYTLNSKHYPMPEVTVQRAWRA